MPSLLRSNLTDTYCSYTLQLYSFKRRPNKTEWNILRSYTRRIWHISGCANPDRWLDSDTLIAICSPPVTDPLFPNLRSLHWKGFKIIPAVHIAVSSLTRLYLEFLQGDVPALKDFLDVVQSQCPNIKHYQIDIPRPHTFDKTICDHIRHQTHLQEFRSHGVIFDAAMILHLSRIPTLARLSLVWIPDEPDWTFSSESAPVFSTLTHMEMGSQLLESVTILLSLTQLPVIEDLSVTFHACPSKEAFKSHLTTIRHTCSSVSLVTIKIRATLFSRFLSDVLIESGHRLTLGDVRPCMAFVNLRHVHINLQWYVDLTDSDLLALASEWPRMHSLVINDRWGWRTTGGITLQGLLQLLQACRSLSELCIAIRTDSFVNPVHGFETGFLAPPSLALSLADSPIRSVDVPALVDTFKTLGMSACSFSAWDGISMANIEGAGQHKWDWNWVFGWVSGKYSGPIGGCGSDESSEEDARSVKEESSW